MSIARVLFVAFFCFCGFSITQGQSTVPRKGLEEKVAVHKEHIATAYDRARDADAHLVKAYGKVIEELDENAYQKRKAKADAGDVDEQVTLAQILQRSGRTQEAKYYFELAANQGDPDAQEALRAFAKEDTFISASFTVRNAVLVVGIASALALAVFIGRHVCAHHLASKTKAH